MDISHPPALKDLLSRTGIPVTGRIRFQDTVISLSRLLAAGNRLARKLRETGVHCGNTVGLLLERHPDYVTATIACWKLGAVAVPLDSGCPLPYAQNLLINGRVDTLICRSRQAGSMLEFSGKLIILENVDYRSGDDAGGSIMAPPENMNEAYRIPAYGKPDSGRTLSITFQALQDMVQTAIGMLGLEQTECFIGITPFECIAGLFEWLAPMMLGSDLFLLDDVSKSDPEKIISSVHCHQASVLLAAPSIWGELLERNFKPPPRLEHIIILGHDLSSHMARRLASTFQRCWWLKTFPDASLWSHMQTIDNETTIPAGSAPHDSASSGMPDETLSWPGAQLIEHGSIETVIEQHPSIRQAAVTLVEHPSTGRISLCAWVVHQSGTANKTTASLRLHLEKSLPGRMIPGHFYFTGAIPLNEQGQKNRRELAARSGQQFGTGDRMRKNPDYRLASIFCRILEIDQAGPDDSFFDLGGNSMLAATLLMSVNAEFGTRIRLRDLLSSPPTLGRLQRLVSADTDKSGDKSHTVSGNGK